MKSGTNHPSQWWNNQPGHSSPGEVEQDLITISEQVRELKLYIKQLEELKVKADNLAAHITEYRDGGVLSLLGLAEAYQEVARKVQK